MNDKKESQPTEFSDVATKIEQNLAKKFFKDTSVAWDQTEDQKTLQARISDILFGMKAQEEMQKMLQRRWKKLEINLRRAFLQRFRFPMKLARGEFIRYCNKEHDITIYSYEGQPFAVEKQVIVVDPDGNSFKGAVAYSVETITDDIPIPTLLKNHIALLPEQLTFDARRYLVRNPSMHLR